mgnify:CR=1 FL=1|tara:strand:+ start:322 stop:966 length:645 start_codon:yes stop_codon:yes gene_type:complete
MHVAKPEHTVFTPELVLSELLEGNYPNWKRDTQRESVEWVIVSMRRFFKVSRPRGCILNADNQIMHEREMGDSGHVALWACNVLRGALDKSSSVPVRFKDACVPVLHTLAFRGAEEELEAFLKSLRLEFGEVLATIDLTDAWTRHEVVHLIQQFEQTNLARISRCAAARVLTKHPILFGGMVYASAFALASLRLQWMEQRTKLMMDAGVVPIFR